MDYGKTLNLPKTDFPMRANLPQKEGEFLERWEEIDVYNKQLLKNKGKAKFVLHDGPPYANGGIHLGTSLNKILKDFIVKFYSMNGYYAPFVPGWDTHGLPTEQRAIKELGLKRHEVGAVKFREACRGFAKKYIDVQRNAFKRLGVRADWNNPYITLKPEFEAEQIKVFGEMAKKKYVYKGLKPVYWCPCCETALAEAEIEYADHNTVSIFVKFRVKDDKGVIFNKVGSDNVNFVIWTTTTWTLPGNMAICINKDFEYCAVLANDEYYIIATELVDSVMKASNIKDYKKVVSFSGKELEGVICKHPFIDRDSLVIVGEHVTLDAGTGCVHTAPGHGIEDFLVCQNYDIDILVPVDSKGYMTKDAGEFEGLFYEEANGAILDKLRQTKSLLATQDILHQYPHCWRCKNPIIFRATEQWFVSIDGFKEMALEQVKNVLWIPKWGEDRITSMIKDRGDWCISRQRTWGVPIPIFYCKKCHKELITDESINCVYELFKKEGSDSWYKYEALDILPKGTKCECGCCDFEKEKDIMDVWFDSGSSHAAVLANNQDLSYPADMYLEGNDQYRGWFQSSLLTAVATNGKAPYKSVVTHGYVVDGEGRKMSKSLGNGIDPSDVIKEYGADILRLWVASCDYKADIRISKKLLSQISEVYRKIRNTSRYIIGNIHDFKPELNSVSYEDLLEIDKVALLKLYRLLEKVNESYKAYEFHVMFHAIHRFCVVDMSNFYLDIIKDRLYTLKPDSKERRAAQTVIYTILDVLVRILTPILAFTSEEIWKYMPHKKGDNLESVQLNDWPVLPDEYLNDNLENKWDKIFDIRGDVSKALEEARNRKVIGHSLNAKVTLYADGEYYELIDSMRDSMASICIVSDFGIEKISDAPDTAACGDLVKDMKIVIEEAEGEKCERCWMYSKTVGQSSEHPTICKRCQGNL